MEYNEHIGKYISYLYRIGQCFINKRLEPYNIGSGQFPYLMVLFNKDGISQESINEIVRMDKATTVRAIKKLVAEGYVHRKRDLLDRRSYKIFLTDRGLSMKPIIFNILREWNSILLKNMDDQEKIFALKLLGKMAENISQLKNN
ncbi:MAG TPA: winged helix-turn-helix transcriptional regulator [Eubacteriaceae bacterium]|jgi:DNA-binding MarR family transcriptional regulator|nr:winged helix-turn-helix transcriptional regulator [Eubacteriaceae bacterium]